MTAAPLVELDQVWQDNDPRADGRQVRVVGVDATHATVHDGNRRSRIRYDRFRPTSSGYRLVRHADGSPAPLGPTPGADQPTA